MFGQSVDRAVAVKRVGGGDADYLGCVRCLHLAAGRLGGKVTGPDVGGYDTSMLLAALLTRS